MQMLDRARQALNFRDNQGIAFARKHIRLLPRVFDGEALFGPGMKDARRGKPAVGQFPHPIYSIAV
jgi:hypothetical protein